MRDSSKDPKQTSEKINWDFVRSWIAAFQGSHGARCSQLSPKDISERPTFPQGFRLIDVLDRRIVRAAVLGNPTYVALSYVWGSTYPWFKAQRANITRLESPAGLTNISLPRTVCDAIEATAELGIRYLWVDNLCIVQDDVEEKMLQIARMGEIYEHATMVIAAIAGDHADYGLPGVAGPRPPVTWRRRPSILEELLGDPRDSLLRDTLELCVYNTRGWTYQEFMVARMHLSFDQSQLHLSCNCGASWTEGYCYEPFRRHTLSSLKILYKLTPLDYHKHGNLQPWLPFDPRLDAQNSSLQVEYCRSVSEYIKRELSCEDDILHAFTAVLAMLRRKWSTRFLWGLPEALFSPSLLWDTRPTSARAQRRSMNPGDQAQLTIPTWTWAGWKKVRTDLSLMVNWQANIWTRQIASPYTAVWHSSRSDRSEDDSTVQFDAWTATFTVVKETVHPRPLAEYNVMDESGTVLAFMDVARVEALARAETEGQECEFVAIIVTKAKNDEDDSAHLLLIDKQEDGTYHRFGVVSIDLAYWEAARPVRKRVVLS